METTVTVQTPAELFATQTVVPVWMHAATLGADRVRVIRTVTPFGTFVTRVDPVS